MDLRVTRHEQSFLSVAADGGRLLIDPGSFTPEVDAQGVAAVVITHGHADHWTPGHLSAIRAANPMVRIFAPADVAELADGFDLDAVNPGDRFEAGPFSLEFVGGEHAPVLTGSHMGANVGVIVNGALYHPGDAYDLPGRPVRALAVPTGGPWAKVSESVDMMLAAGAPLTFNIHDETLSPAGRGMWKNIFTAAAEARGLTYVDLDPGESVTLPTD